VFLTLAAVLCFNLGVWYFGFHYYECSSNIKFMAAYQNNDQDVKLEQNIKRNSIIFKTVYALNVFAVIFMTFVKAYQAWEYEENHFTTPDYEID